MVAALSLLVVVTVSILITRIATVMLTHTGLSQETARFQARSAISGTGFTTAEAERVVRHPLRRRIVMVLMLLGNAGIVGAVSTLMLALINAHNSGSLLPRVVLLAAGLALLWGIAASPWVDRGLGRIIDRALKRYTQLEVRDFASLLRLSGAYRVVEIAVEPEDWMCGRSLAELKLRDEGIIVLGIQRGSDTYLGVPKGENVIVAGDVLMAYGRADRLEALDQRGRGHEGEREHAAAKAAQREELKAQADVDSETRGDAGTGR